MVAVGKLSQWYEKVARALPWRATRDPYSIWISEVMLQQTQVITVLPYYSKFLERFPTVQALAESPEPEVLRLWAGLGYYSRARNLRNGARYLVEHHRGQFPRTREAILKVPGIGPYTAGAILSIAFDLPVPLVDGNVQRVFSRYYALEEELESKAAQGFYWSRATEWVDAAQSPRILNQALMELGATVCTKAAPRCGLCPLQKGCEAFRQDRPAEFPKRRPRRKAEKLWWAPLVYEKSGRILLELNGPGEWWHGLWDFPHVAGKSPADLQKLVDKLGDSEALERQEHTVTHHRIHVSPFVLRWSGKARSSAKRAWVTLDEAERLPLSSLAKKILGSVKGDPRCVV